MNDTVTVLTAKMMSIGVPRLVPRAQGEIGGMMNNTHLYAVDFNDSGGWRESLYVYAPSDKDAERQARERFGQRIFIIACRRIG